MKRRTFLKIVGMGSISLAAGCTPDPYGAPRPDKTLFSLVQAPDDMVTGKGTWYAATCRECPAGCGVIAKNREGRVTKLEGNPVHPINRGTLCMRGQAALQGIYNPDRLKTPLLKENGSWRPITFEQAQTLLQQKIEAAAAKGSDRVRMITETVGEVQYKLFRDAMQRWQSDRPLVFEPLAYEALKKANLAVFGIPGLVSYRIEDADMLVSFGADFLETWLSPVEYARRFKQMHALNGQSKGVFVHIAPYRSLTGANADQWLACRPGSEAVIALGMAQMIMDEKGNGGLSSDLATSLKKAAAPYTLQKTAELSGVPAPQIQKLADRLLAARKPLILGTAAGSVGTNAYQANLAANCLNALLDPDLTRVDMDNRHRVEMADSRATVLNTFEALQTGPVEVLLLNNVNPVHTLPPNSGAAEALQRSDLFVAAFGSCLDETAEAADLVFPVKLPLESWDEYAGKSALASTLQPAMGRLTQAPHIGDIFLRIAFGDTRTNAYKSYLIAQMADRGLIGGEIDWLTMIQKGGRFNTAAGSRSTGAPQTDQPPSVSWEPMLDPIRSGLFFATIPSLRYFDGRGANRSWLNEVPDPLTRVAWQTPLLINARTAGEQGLRQGDIVEVQSGDGTLTAPLYITDSVVAGVLTMALGQGHRRYGRYATGKGVDPLSVLPAEADPQSGGPLWHAAGVQIRTTGQTLALANTDGNRTQQGRKIALSVALDQLPKLAHDKKHGLAMHDFPLTLPLPEGYDPHRDFYPPIQYEAYRWAMVVDLDRCIGCGACAAACYAENNIGIVGEERILEGREMAWLSVERYMEPDHLVFLPLMCQHCDNAPCESVCPVYAPHHNKEGMNNQIYNRCIGTRFCAQNCPYKVRRFNWYTWRWPEPLNMQLNPNVTVRSKGVMEKCSFCVQRIKEAHGAAKNENRQIKDGEIIPACVQTCPTYALTFGNLMDKNSRVRRLAADPRAYQIMGYLNTKTAVIYLKKVTQTV